jgi:hypothetical protein
MCNKEFIACCLPLPIGLMLFYFCFGEKRRDEEAETTNIVKLF